MSDTMHIAAELAQEARREEQPESTMTPMQKRLAFADAVTGIALEIERNANAIDPREVTATSVLVDLAIDTAQALKLVARLCRPEVRS